MLKKINKKIYAMKKRYDGGKVFPITIGTNEVKYSWINLTRTMKKTWKCSWKWSWTNIKVRNLKYKWRHSLFWDKITQLHKNINYPEVIHKVNMILTKDISNMLEQLGKPWKKSSGRKIIPTRYQNIIMRIEFNLFPLLQQL